MVTRPDLFVTRSVKADEYAQDDTDGSYTGSFDRGPNAGTEK